MRCCTGERVEPVNARGGGNDRLGDIILADALVCGAVGRAGVAAVGRPLALIRVTALLVVAAVVVRPGIRRNRQRHRGRPGEQGERHAGGEEPERHSLPAGAHHDAAAPAAMVI